MFYTHKHSLIHLVMIDTKCKTIKINFYMKFLKLQPRIIALIHLSNQFSKKKQLLIEKVQFVNLTVLITPLPQCFA